MERKRIFTSPASVRRYNFGPAVPHHISAEFAMEPQAFFFHPILEITTFVLLFRRNPSFHNDMETFRFACDHLVKLCSYYWQPDRLIIIEYFETFIFTLIRHRLDFPYLSEPERKEFNDCLSKWLSVVKEMNDRKLREDEDWPRHQLQL